MAVKQAYLMIEGQKVLASYDSGTQKYTVETNAPATSSWNKPDHVVKLELFAEDDAGNKASMNSSNPTYGSQLKIRVLEKSKPTATITFPTEGAVLGAKTQTVRFTLKDVGDSGLNMSSVSLKVNGKAVTQGINYSDGSGGEKIGTYTASNLADGANKVELSVADNDGNRSITAVTNFVVSTAAPLLTVTSPANNLITNRNRVTVSGTVAPGSDHVTISEVTVNGTKASLTTGKFTHEVALTEGRNEIEIIAKDNLGKTTKVTRIVNLDTKAPVISDVVAEATTVNASGKIKITFKVVDPA